MVLARKERVWWFAGTAATVYTAVFCMARAHAHAANAGGVGLGAACDLTITVPVLFYLLLVWPGFSSWITLVAMVIGGARATAFLLPAAKQRICRRCAGWAYRWRFGRWWHRRNIQFSGGCV
ncbi:MAG: hypothetical protein ACLP59_05815 [Bryobacteraceae bacterium]